MELYNNFNKLFKSNPNINELGLVVSTSKYDGGEEKPFIMVENNLAISYRYVSMIYKYCFHTLNQLLVTLPSTFKDIETKNGCNDDDQMKLGDDTLDQLLCLTRTLLLVNAENITALNTRKRLICIKLIKHSDEIKLLNLIFTKHPKSGEAWCHRRWVLTNSMLFNTSTFSMDTEMMVCKRVAEIYPRNYYAWTHRWWVLNQSNHMTFDNLIKDLNLVELWIKRNVSDHSAYNHRYLILCKLYNSRVEFGQSTNQVIDLWLKEIKMIDHFIVTYPAHESIWHYKRSLLLFWINQIQSQVTLESIQPSSSEYQLPTLDNQLSFIDSVQQDIDSSYYQDQLTQSQIYHKWISFSFNKIK